MENRKAFNFYRSYYEIAKELPEEERGAFLMAILETQFTGKEPDLSKLSLLCKFAYISQKHSIEKQIRGFEDANKKPKKRETPKTNPKGKPQRPTPKTNPPSQEQVQVQEEEDVVLGKKIDEIYLEYREKYKNYANQLFGDAIFIESISKGFIKNQKEEIRKMTIKKYLQEFLNSLDQVKKIHNNKKEFQEHFPNWLRKQGEIKLVYPPKEKIRYG